MPDNVEKCPSLSCCAAVALRSILALGKCRGHSGTHKHQRQSTLPLVEFAMPGRYMDNANQYFEEYLPGPKRTVFHTRKGLSWRNAWGVLRYSANNAFIAFVHADQMKKQVIALAAQYHLSFAWHDCGKLRAASCILCSPGRQLMDSAEEYVHAGGRGVCRQALHICHIPDQLHARGWWSVLCHRLWQGLADHSIP